MTIAAAAPSNSAWKWWICCMLLLATTLNYMDRMALNQTAVRIMDYFQLNNRQYGLIEGTFSFAFAIGALVIGIVVDRANLKWVYPIMVVGWSMAGMLTGFANSLVMLFMCRFLLGLFEAGNWPCGVLTVKRVLKPEERSLGNGMFQSGTALGAIITPLIVLGCLEISDPNSRLRIGLQTLVGGGGETLIETPPTAWQLPFRVIGAIGLLWAVLWLVTVKSHHLAPPSLAVQAIPRQPFSRVLRDRRYWVLLGMVIAINTTWHTFRVWLPPYLQKGLGSSEAAMARFSSLYYIAADVGSITIGLGTLWLTRRGTSVHSARLLAFGLCSMLTLCSIGATFMPQGLPFDLMLLAIAFGSLGLFPTYFAFSQEISVHHQGKVTGSLGFLNALYLAVLAPTQGWIIDQTKSYTLILGLAGLAPLVALGLMLAFWRSPREGTPGM